MMREGDKLASYRILARVLERVRDLDWRLLVMGDGNARDAVRSVLEAAAPGRASFLGARPYADIAALNGASDLCIWPGVNEAYGMAMLEAQAAGLPVVSCATRGVPDVVAHGRSGLLAPEADDAALADLLRGLLTDEGARTRMGAAAAEFVASERSIGAAGASLERFLRGIPALAGLR
jgi:glycosyltransferase involved in cell wall biosynthesis